MVIDQKKICFAIDYFNSADIDEISSYDNGELIRAVQFITLHYLPLYISWLVDTLANADDDVDMGDVCEMLADEIIEYGIYEIDDSYNDEFLMEWGICLEEVQQMLVLLTEDEEAILKDMVRIMLEDCLIIFTRNVDIRNFTNATLACIEPMYSQITCTIYIFTT